MLRQRALRDLPECATGFITGVLGAVHRTCPYRTLRCHHPIDESVFGRIDRLIEKVLERILSDVSDLRLDENTFPLFLVVYLFQGENSCQGVFF